MTKATAKEKLISAGGQAVIEGVMMRSKHHLTIAVRKPTGTISLRTERIRSLSDKLPFLAWPFFRGIVAMIEMMVIGVRALNYSANESLGEHDEEMTPVQIGLSLVLALGFAILLFKFLPLLLAQIIQNYFPIVKKSYALFNIIDGMIKITLFVLYIACISVMQDVRRLFMYHGAEHAAVNCYEARLPLTPKNVLKHTTIHPRCGTSFILIVLILSVFMYTFIPRDYSFWPKLGLRILFLPVIAGIAYEVLRLAGRYRESWFMKVVSWPGMLMQRLTTRRFDSKQAEVAISALQAVLKKADKS
ncbi:DUF1385 domain-containing protein [Candidatus Woesearchaeota archaeon]|nr:DUF1385 domain-containing protein [Candidatus Woesearchaeota archaeon]